MSKCCIKHDIKNYRARFEMSNKAKKLFYGLFLKEHKSKRVVSRMKKVVKGANWNKVFIIHPVTYDNTPKEIEIEIIN